MLLKNSLVDDHDVAVYELEYEDLHHIGKLEFRIIAMIFPLHASIAHFLIDCAEDVHAGSVDGAYKDFQGQVAFDLFGD